MATSTKNSTTSQKKKVPIKGELICIDLPGEDFQIQGPGCFMVKDYTVLLRKHRDVIFDLNIGNGAIYTIESEEEWFYDFKAAKRTKKATFKDGERFHIWISRNFRTIITLKSNEKKIASYPIGLMDPTPYGDDPYDKPAPIIIALGKGGDIKHSAEPTPQVVGNSHFSNLSNLADPSAETARDFNKAFDRKTKEKEATQETMHIVEVSQTEGSNVPQQIASFFKKGGEETAIDTSGILTRNWLWAQIGGAIAYYDDNKPWIKELWRQKFFLQKVQHRNAGTKWYIVFRGYPGLRQYLTASRYPVINPKVIGITSGVGSAKGMGHAAWEASKGSFKKAGLLGIILTITLDTAEWFNDYEQRDPITGKPKKDFFDLAFKIGVDLAKAGISAALGAVAMGALVLLGIVTGGVAVVVGAIILSVVIGLGIDWLDKKTGAMDSLNKSLRNGATYLQDKLSMDYQHYDSALAEALGSGRGYA